jgi:predicted TIM-barrel fold metal-dependent hydrolase
MTAASRPVVDACLYEASLWRDLARESDPDRPADDAVSILAAMDRSGVSVGLVVLDRELERVVASARRRPGRLLGLVFYDALEPERSLERVRACCEAHGDTILGVATAFPCAGRDPRLQVYAPLYEYCVRNGLPLQCRLGGCSPRDEASRPLAVGVLAAVYPRLTLVCLHDGGDLPHEMPGLLGRFPNLYLATNDWQSADPQRRSGVGSLLAKVGSGRLLFASGGTRATAPDPLARAAVERLPRRHRDNVCWRTAAHVFGPRLLPTDRSAAPPPMR